MTSWFYKFKTIKQLKWGKAVYKLFFGEQRNMVGNDENALILFVFISLFYCCWKIFYYIIPSRRYNIHSYESHWTNFSFQWKWKAKLLLYKDTLKICSIFVGFLTKRRILIKCNFFSFHLEWKSLLGRLNKQRELLLFYSL